MQTLSEAVFKLEPPFGVFCETVVRNLFSGRSEGARRAIVHRAVASGEVLRLKPGLFCLAEPFRKHHPHPFALAGMLHSSSHISMESALWFHELIPEAVHEVTSVTERRSRTFRTPLGVYSFTRIPTNYPRAGVRAIEVDKHAWAFVATPLRAIADLVYAKRQTNGRQVTWSRDGARFLTESMRIELDDLRELGSDDGEEILESIRNGRTRRYLAGLIGELEA